jgi:UDP-glucose 4-epimerase
LNLLKKIPHYLRGNMKKVLITGCSGYIGSHLCKMLKLQGKYEVHGLDLYEPQVTIDKFYTVDINRLFTIPDQLDPYDAVIHLAALVNVSESERMPIMYYITNLNGTMNIVNKIPTNNFIFASTGAAALCQSDYAISKRAAESTVKEYCTVHRPQNYTIFRFYNVIGSDGFKPTNTDGLMTRLLESINTGKFTIFGNDYNTPDGTCIRDYVHVNEVCHALIEAIENPSKKIENLAHGIGTSVKEIVDLFQQVNNIKLDVGYGPRRPGDVEISVLDSVSPYMKNLYSLEDLLKIR